MLFAVRDTGVGLTDLFEPLPQLVVLGLPEDDARTLLRSVAGGAIDAKVADRLVEETEGNPLALTEVVAELTAEQLRGDAPLPEPVPVGRSLQDQFAARARLLPSAGRTVLLLASAERLGDPALLHRAARLLGAPWEEAVTSIEATGLVTFALRSALSSPTDPVRRLPRRTAGERRRAHRALADALDGDDDVDRRAWHLAAAAAARTRTSRARWNWPEARVPPGRDAGRRRVPPAGVGAHPDPSAGLTGSSRPYGCAPPRASAACAAAARRCSRAFTTATNGRKRVDAGPDLARRRPRPGRPARWRAGSPRSRSTTASSSAR